MKDEKKYKYQFLGSVVKFGVPICKNWQAETTAPNEKKALSNLKYRFKKEFNLIASVPIELIGSIFIKR